ncbi:alkaline phosphatase family protein [Oleiharenicola lentus]|uniref:alkaline phosphatase family protein n=1 Tax=Oleiharenicola lentus TaxID=2508720 RepID=UPI003F664218
MIFPKIFLRAWFGGIGFAMGALTGISADSAPKPSLVVAISIDQFRADYLTRFGQHFGTDGFNLFLKHGANFCETRYRHAHTKTACGHSVMLTGVHADVHGVIANDWVDRHTFEAVSNVGDASVRIIGLPAASGVKPYAALGEAAQGRSPKRLLAPTIGDELKAVSAQSKVIGISNKDRAAILMTGARADAAYFMEKGHMVSSTYYFPELPAWVKQWNAAEKLAAYYGKVWDRLLPIEAYAVQGPDAAAGEDTKSGELGNTLPKTITGGESSAGDRFDEALKNTPFMNDLLVDFAKSAIESEKLGKRGVTDILCVSFSANDYIGHLYGPDSHEIMDNVVRMDRTLAEFFKYLDDTIGLKNCTLVLTADHGVAPMPERLAVNQPGVPSGRSFGKETTAAAEAALNKTYGPLADGSNWLVRDDAYFIVHPSALREKKVDSAAAQIVVRDALLTVEMVARAYTRAQLEAGEATDEIDRMALRSFNRERSGDVYLITKPYYFNKATGSTHGSPYDYDTHVPLLWYGVGVKPGESRERTGVDDLAPTLAHILGLPKPPKSEGKNLF